MRLALNPRARRLLRRVPHITVYSAAELLLLSLLAVQCARLFWTLLTPVNAVGEWNPPRAGAAIAAASMEILSGFDPFFRLSSGGAAVVTSLNLTLFGTREDQASGRGSAIIGKPDGQQQSFGVGDEIMPGVRLESVGFDSVTINRNGISEQLFLDQSAPLSTQSVVPVAATPSAATPSAGTTSSSDMLGDPSPPSEVTGNLARPETRQPAAPAKQRPEGASDDTSQRTALLINRLRAGAATIALERRGVGTSPGAGDV